MPSNRNILTCTYICNYTPTPVTIVDLCREKTPFPPLISAFIQADWLINFWINYVVSSFSLGYTEVYPPFYVSCTMPSLMHLTFAKKQRTTFFDPPGGRVGQKLFTLIEFHSYILRVTSPFFPVLSKLGSCRASLPGFI